jgi:hypothetical protein
MWRGLAMASVAVGLSFAAAAEQAVAPAPRNQVTARELVVEPPTLIALGFEWYVQGDDNGNARVAVSYRLSATGTGKPGDWRESLPLIRVERGDRTAQYGVPVVMAERPNLLAGSILDLQPDTAYDVRLVMSDPDGVSGERQRIVKAHTRAEPMPAPGGRVFHVYPPDFKGTPQRPAFIGLLAAYYNGPRLAADHYNVYPPRVQPGDTILVHAGVYKDNRYVYGTASVAIADDAPFPANIACCGATFHGTYHLIASGTAEKPIVIKAAGDGPAIFDGDGNGVLFNVVAGNYHYFEGLTFRNTEVAIEAGQKGIAGSVGLTVKHSRFENFGEGIHTDWGGSKNFYIADNDFQGRLPSYVLVPWSMGTAAQVQGPRLKKIPGINESLMKMTTQYAVKVYGSGHVIAFNRARDVHDAFDHGTYGAPDGWPHTPRDRMPVANDFYNNDMSNMHDDCIEVDGMAYNARIVRNKCVNAAGSAFSASPAFGGPTYIVRNIAYHLPSNFEAIKGADAPGLSVYNNTFITALRNPGPTADVRNNLIFAEFPEETAVMTGAGLTPQGGGTAAGAASTTIANALSGGGAAVVAPRIGMLDYNGYFNGSGSAGSVAAARKAQGLDTHSIDVDYRIFDQLAPADTDNIVRVYDPNTIDVKLKAASPAIDAGVALPSITDGFLGKAPDLGALESGTPAPHYGPRTSN